MNANQMNEVLTRIFAAAVRVAERDEIDLSTAIARHMDAIKADYPEMYDAMSRALCPA
jgi:hypothetical protein